MRSKRSTPHRAHRDSTAEGVHDSTILEDFANDYGHYVDVIQPTIECGTPPRDPRATRALRTELLRRAPLAQRALLRSGHRVRIQRRPGYEAVPEPESLAAFIVAHEHPAYSDPRDPLATARTVFDHLTVAAGKLRAEFPQGPAAQEAHSSVVLREPVQPSNLLARLGGIRAMVASAAGLYTVGQGAVEGMQFVLRLLSGDL